jgi:hypothetical protein
MKSIDVFYQGDGIPALEHLEADTEATFGSLRAQIAGKHDLGNDCLIFLEDENEPADEKSVIGKMAGRGGIKVHVHRCRKVAVAVHFRDQTVRDEFPPSATIARVKHWVAVRKLGMSEEEASDHHLQLTGTTDQPDPGTHIGALAACRKCKVEFDLVSTPKVNGAWDEA